MPNIQSAQYEYTCNCSDFGYSAAELSRDWLELRLSEIATGKLSERSVVFDVGGNAGKGSKCVAIFLRFIFISFMFRCKILC